MGCAVRGGEKVSLAALLSGYLGKSGHLPRVFFFEFLDLCCKTVENEIQSKT